MVRKKKKNHLPNSDVLDREWWKEKDNSGKESEIRVMVT